MAAPRATAAPPPEFDPIEYGASLMLAWQVRDKPVLIVGGGAVAAGSSLPPTLPRFRAEMLAR